MAPQKTLWLLTALSQSMTASAYLNLYNQGKVIDIKIEPTKPEFTIYLIKFLQCQDKSNGMLDVLCDLLLKITIRNYIEKTNRLHEQFANELSCIVYNSRFMFDVVGPSLKWIALVMKLPQKVVPLKLESKNTSLQEPC